MLREGILEYCRSLCLMGLQEAWPGMVLKSTVGSAGNLNATTCLTAARQNV